MSDIVADIVRRALAPAPVSEDGTPRETPLEERLRLLHNALGGTQQRVDEQQRKLETLRAEIDEYRALMKRVQERAVEMERAAAALPAPRPAPAPAPQPAPAECARVQPAPDCDRSQRLPEPAPLSQVPPAPLPSIPLDAAAGSALSAECARAQSVDDCARAQSVDKSPAPSPAPRPRPLEDAVTPRWRWAHFAPYAAIAAFGVAMSAFVAKHPAAPALKPADVPAPAMTAQNAPLPADAAAAAATADPAPAASEDESNAEVLNLVSSYVPPGSKRSVADILGPEMDDPATDSPWTIMRVDEHTTLVSFRPYGDVLESAPVYEFTVDPAAKTVTASAETLANLRGPARAVRTAAR